MNGEDLTEFVASQRQNVDDSKLELLLIPTERVYLPQSAQARRTVRLEADHSGVPWCRRASRQVTQVGRRSRSDPRRWLKNLRTSTSPVSEGLRLCAAC